MQLTARQAIVTGTVQGVCFREYTRRKAAEIGIKGWVRNRADGSVETYICGSVEAVSEMSDWLQQGSPHARVSGVELTEREVDTSLTSFNITY